MLKIYKIEVMDTKQALVAELNNILTGITMWNEETFPDATREGQFAKLEEELMEVKQARQNWKKKKELADVIIVLGGLLRWKSLVAKFMLDDLKKLPEAELRLLIKNVCKKMKINQERTEKGLWKKQKDGSYHH